VSLFIRPGFIPARHEYRTRRKAGVFRVNILVIVGARRPLKRALIFQAPALWQKSGAHNGLAAFQIGIYCVLLIWSFLFEFRFKN
jgi:hypothetical protein